MDIPAKRNGWWLKSQGVLEEQVPAAEADIYEVPVICTTRSLIRRLLHPDAERTLRLGKPKGTYIGQTSVEPIRHSKLDKLKALLPTPYDKFSKKVDACYVVAAVKTIMQVCPKGATVVIESTVSPGTIDKFIRPVIEENGFVIGKDINLVHAPERIMCDCVQSATQHKPVVYIHYSPEEHTYPEHIATMVSDLQRCDYPVVEDADYDYTDHGDVAKYFPQFLLKTLTKLVGQ